MKVGFRVGFDFIGFKMGSGFLGTQFFFSAAAAHCVEKRPFYRIVNFSFLKTLFFLN